MLNKSQNTKKQQINPLLTRATPFSFSLSLTRPKLARLDWRKFVGNMIGPPPMFLSTLMLQFHVTFYCGLENFLYLCINYFHNQSLV